MKSSRWTEEETVIVKQKFKNAIAEGRTPTLKESQALTLDRNSKQIQDKVRTLIRQGKKLLFTHSMNLTALISRYDSLTFTVLI